MNERIEKWKKGRRRNDWPHSRKKKKGKVTNERKKMKREWKSTETKHIENERAERVREWLNEISKERQKDRKSADVWGGRRHFEKMERHLWQI